MSAPILEKKAREWPCPLARTFEPKAMQESGGRCIGARCILWRERPLMVDDPGYQNAIRRAEAEGMKPNVAARYVNGHRKELGLPDAPFLGWCGLGQGPTT